VKFAAIADWADLGTYPVVFMCAELEVSRSGYYAWRLGGPSARVVADQGFTVMIKAIYDQGRGNPGEADHRPRRPSGHRPGPDQTGLHRREPRYPLGWGHYLFQDLAGVGLLGDGH
jgi:putative transposase